MLFRGYLPIMSGWGMAQFLDRLNQGFDSLKPSLLQNSERVKNHAMAKKQGRAFQYLTSNIKKDEAARELARRDGIQHGLVCVAHALKDFQTSYWKRSRAGLPSSPCRRQEAFARSWTASPGVSSPKVSVASDLAQAIERFSSSRALNKQVVGRYATDVISNLYEQVLMVGVAS